MSPLRVLIVEDSPPDGELMLRALRAGGFEPLYERVETPEAMREALARQTWDIVLSDYYLPRFDAPAALALLREQGQDLPFIVVSGSVGEDTAVAAMRAGAPQREELEIIRDAGVRAQELIRQLLAFSARQVLQPVVLDLNSLVKNITKMLRPLIGEDIELVTVLAPDLANVRADPGQLEQVLVNLAVNARDAMPAGGRLTIETHNVAVPDSRASQHAQVPPGRYVVLRVTDTGVGMDPETQQRVFDPFYTTKPRGKGSGLGLATAYGIVRQSGGDMTLESAVGAGSTFRIYLPRVAEPVERGAAPAVSVPAAGSETVLLAEDEQLVRVLARKVLEQAGYTVLVAAGGAEALEIARRHDGPIHLLLTDVVMPEMSGRELMHRITQVRPDTRVLYMSGYADEAIAHHGVLDPGTAFMQKPFTPGTLATKVRAVLDGR